jgi:chaperone required for assembly of F1-ATPase
VRRFYKDVSVTAERGITLDGRPVRTPSKAPLLLPTAAMADAVAEEWRAQGDKIDPRSMPMTGLANAAIDRVATDPVSFAATLAVFAESELLCYRAEEPEPLVSRQAKEWDPMLAWARARYDVGFGIVAGIMHQPQPAETLSRLGDAVATRSDFELAALNPLVTISGSLVLALAVLEREMDADTAFATAHLDELWQAEQWGDDDFAIKARAEHHRDFVAAARFLELLG